MVISEKQINATIGLYTEIVRKCCDSKWSFPAGGKPKITVQDFLTKFQACRGGKLSGSELVDYCIYQANMYREWGNWKHKWTAGHSFGPNALKRYIGANTKNQKYMQDKWLESGGLRRNDLYSRFLPPTTHPLSAYTFMVSEEGAKQRHLNEEAGYYLCQQLTLGWTPFSETCCACNFQEKCSQELKRKVPELYRIRVEADGSKI